MALIRIQLRRGTAAGWLLANPVLAIGEPGLETDTKLQKVGDGVSTWAQLGYATIAPEDVQDALDASAAAGTSAFNAGQSAATALGHKNAAETAAAAAQAVPTTTDGLVKGLLDNPGSATATALTATYGPAAAGMVSAFGPDTQAESAPLKAAFVRRGRDEIFPVANRQHVMIQGDSFGISDGVVTGRTTQHFHTASCAFKGMRLMYANVYNNAGVDTPGPNNITIKANIRITGGINLPVFFNGKRSVVLEPGAVILSDPVGFQLFKTATFYTRTYVSVASGEKFPLGRTTDGVQEGIVAGDFADGSVSVNVGRGYGPWGLFGSPTNYGAPPLESPGVLVFGDSITAGAGDAYDGSDAYGWAARALDGKLPYLNVAVSSAAASGANTQGELSNRMRMIDAWTPDAGLIMFGTNDLAGPDALATIKANFKYVVNSMRARGMSIYGATVPPNTTSTDSWATTVNQTPYSSEADRVLFNDWIRTTAADATLVGFFETADTVETARNSGIWKAAYTADGVHPNVTGHTAMAAALDPTVIGPLLT